MLFRPALLIAGAGLAVAQSLSNQCTQALISIASSPSASCLDLTLLAPLALSNSSTTSVVPTINSWLIGMCSQGPCSNSTLQTIVNDVLSGCSTDLASLGLTTSNPTALVTTVQVAYPPLRQVVCLKDTAANSLCMTEVLNDIQSATTTLSLNNIASLVSLALSGQTLPIPQSIACSNCSKAAYTIFNKDFPSLASSEQSALQTECGSSFTNGQMPSGIQETAANSSSTGAATSLSVNGLNVGVAMLVAVSSAFAMFA